MNLCLVQTLKDRAEASNRKFRGPSFSEKKTTAF